MAVGGAEALGFAVGLLRQDAAGHGLGGERVEQVLDGACSFLGCGRTGDGQDRRTDRTIGGGAPPGLPSTLTGLDRQTDRTSGGGAPPGGKAWVPCGQDLKHPFLGPTHPQQQGRVKEQPSTPAPGAAARPPWFRVVSCARRATPARGLLGAPLAQSAGVQGWESRKVGPSMMGTHLSTEVDGIKFSWTLGRGVRSLDIWLKSREERTGRRSSSFSSSSSSGGR